jgi:carboxyl-terminal processing protease
MKHPFLTASVLALALLQACKKSDVTPNSLTPTPTTPVAATGDKWKDTALLYSRDIYLWYNQIPSTFNAQTHTDISGIMTAIRQYSNEPGFSAPVDRWSFAVKRNEWDNVSSGIAGDFGLNVFFRAEGDLRVRQVEPASPAGRAGVRRGWRITAINGNNNITTANASFIVQNIYQSSTANISFQKPDNSTVQLSLNAGTYQEQPVILDTVYTTNGRRTGYFALNSFLGDTTQIYNAFNRIFNGFAAAGVQDVVVDLRYNGGGYVTVSQKLANWLAPASANGQVMMNQQFNDKYTQYNETERFSKLGSLNLNRIFFIVSSSTASASELLINNLKPYLDVQLIGPSKTYGKPVGYFPIPVGEWYIFPVSFKSTNKNSEGGYFNGITLNNTVPDGLDKDWGDVTESALQSALNYINTGAYRTSTAAGSAPYQQKAEVISGNTVIDLPSFKGTVDTRRIR